MHEMSLVEGVRQLIEEAALRDGFTRVHSVRVEIGQLSGVEQSAFEFCFDLAMQDSPAAGARLDIIATPGRGRCQQCGQESALAAVYDPCELCGAYSVEVIGGTSMRVIDLEVE
ncbi:MAG: hydrogenase maturation nickel metallochaperone HypA [Gammaproteobacteria bacterium]|nr:hydrogenase maturation nickel metallochaperone HypA [Rhodocyclaceae bacterium]MBU3909769.1 hydrogenase maturation nickel metallochaperone HypA [Gammaproteobacteria bacterium]MBU3988196.1 hydrogenase maturation nickel metallochaperone HypA [Gammaproteobacteria bacterium]MBU4005302.1 hydrogenase maturation nickel metallochaperone HypA [Gammaproteobacteria bacterium]MBU4022480.1 hydrogenase maturation nickel metallochaperone HypA [Gammaproteobacteria bacterium]